MTFHFCSTAKIVISLSSLQPNNTAFDLDSYSIETIVLPARRRSSAQQNILRSGSGTSQQPSDGNQAKILHDVRQVSSCDDLLEITSDSGIVRAI